MTQPVYILGGYQTDFARSFAREGLDISDMVREATLGALANCELEPGAVASIHVGNAFGEARNEELHRVAVAGHLAANGVLQAWLKAVELEQRARVHTNHAVDDELEACEADTVICSRETAKAWSGSPTFIIT